jgi:thioredoxin-related protein
MHLKRIFSTIFILIFVFLIGWLFMRALKPDVLPIGSSLPELEYNDSTEIKILKHANNLYTIIVIFNRSCEHCQYQLKQFNKNMDKFVDTQLFLFTTEQSFFTKEYIEQFDILAQAENVNWGIVNKKQFKKKFGSMVLPTIFLFNKPGKLINKIRGEVRIEKILEKLGGPERQASGFK